MIIVKVVLLDSLLSVGTLRTSLERTQPFGIHSLGTQPLLGTVYIQSLAGNKAHHMRPSSLADHNKLP